MKHLVLKRKNDVKTFIDLGEKAVFNIVPAWVNKEEIIKNLDINNVTYPLRTGDRLELRDGEKRVALLFPCYDTYSISEIYRFMRELADQIHSNVEKSEELLKTGIGLGDIWFTVKYLTPLSTPHVEFEMKDLSEYVVAKLLAGVPSDKNMIVSKQKTIKVYF